MKDKREKLQGSPAENEDWEDLKVRSVKVTEMKTDRQAIKSFTEISNFKSEQQKNK